MTNRLLPLSLVLEREESCILCGTGTTRVVPLDDPASYQPVCEGCTPELAAVLQAEAFGLGRLGGAVWTPGPEYVLLYHLKGD